jgi:hypothetical protein
MLVALGSIGALLLATAPGAAGQAATKTSLYHPTEGARSFTGGANGWTATSGASGLCLLPPLLCPAIANTAPTSDGAPGGYIATVAGPSLIGVGATVSGTWRSPTFVYNGAEGTVANLVTFSMSRRANVSSLLNVAGTSADYSVDLVNATSGLALQLIINSPLAGANAWTTVPTVVVDPSRVVVGQSYFFRITSQFVKGADVIPAANADYDNVTLTAQFVPPDGPPVINIPENRLLTDRFLTDFIKNNTPNWAGVTRKKLLVTTRCPGRAVQQRPRCQFDVGALWHRRGPAATNVKSFALIAKGKKRFGLTIKKRFRQKIRRRDEILVRFHVVIGDINVTVYKQLRPVLCSKRPVC